MIRSVVGKDRAGDILPLALNDKDVANRREAARQLSDVRDEPLTRFAIKDPDEEVRSEAAEVAASAGYEGVLVIAASDASAGIRIKAAHGLGAGGWPDAWKPLKTLAMDPDAGVAAEAVASLGRLGDRTPSAVWAGLALDTNNQKALRLTAMSAYIGRKETGSAEVISRALGDRDPEIKKAAVDGLKGLGAKSLPALHSLLKDKDMRLPALELLSDIGDTTSEGPVLAELPHMDNAARVKAVYALGRFGGPKSVGPMAGCYKDGPDDVKNAVVKSLGLMKLPGDDPAVIGILSDALGSGSDSIRFHAAHSAAALKAGRLRGDIEKRLGVEQSSLIKEELTKAVSALSGPGTP